jgi:proteasome lid subunit RPN8/RPN11
MVVHISRELLDVIMAQAMAAAPRECCGLLLSHGEPRRIEAVQPAMNVAADPESRFEIDPLLLLAHYRAQRTGGAQIIGCYHSHPRGNPDPSMTDAAQAEGRGEVWLICSSDGDRATAWIARPGGSVHGMFSPAGLIVE